MSNRITSALLLGAMLVFGASTVVAQVNVFSTTTSTGNDTLYVGIPGSIIFSIDAAGQNLSSITMPISFDFGGAGNLIGPVWTSPPGGDAAFIFSAYSESKMENRPFNDSLGAYFVEDPDSLLWGVLDFNGDGFDANEEIARITFTPLGEGTITIDSMFIPPANRLEVLDQNADTLPRVWMPYTVTIITKPNEPPVITDCGSDLAPNPAVGGQTITGTIVANDPDASPSPTLSYYLNDVQKGGVPVATPAGMSMVGNVFTFVSDLADEGDWTVEVGVTDGLTEDDAFCTLQFSIQGAAPFNVCIGTNEAFSNSDVTVCITGLNLAPNPLAGGFDLLLDYDGSLLTLKSVVPGDALIDVGWEYFTYRIVSVNPAKIRIVAIADMNNSNVHPDPVNPNGDIACLTFHTTNDRTLACQKAYLRFEWEDCGDNSISDASGDTLFIVGGAAPPIIDDQMSGQDFYMQVPDIYGWNATATEDCPGTDKQTIKPFITFCNGWIKIKCPGDIDDRGDINLNGFAYEIADAVLYSNYFIVGTSAFDPVYYEAQIAASDINADGVPLTVADLVYMIRVITGDAEPIAEDLLGGGPKVASAVGSLEVTAAQKGSNLTIKASSDQDLGAGLFVFKYDAEISEVTLSDRASAMDVTYEASEGELRVLVYNIEDGAKIAAGTGELMTVVSTGSVELVSVEAATFMGGNLETNVTAKVIPTAYALHQNYPNPFNPSTSMAIDFPNAGDYTLTVYNIAGQTVKTFSGSTEAGTLTITWDGNDNHGSKVASGVYFYRVQADVFHAVKKMVLMK